MYIFLHIRNYHVRILYISEPGQQSRKFVVEKNVLF